MNQFIAVTAAMAALCLPLAATADYDAARVAYKRGDHATALREFRQSAELGHPDAQFNVGAMYLRGEAVESNLANAFAWMYLAAENGVLEARPTLNEIKGRLTPEDVQIVQDLRARFGKAALEKTLLATPEELAYVEAPSAGSALQRILSSAPPAQQDSLYRRFGRCKADAYNLNTRIGVTSDLSAAEIVVGFGIVVVYAEVAADGAVRGVEDILMYPQGALSRDQYKCFQSATFAPAVGIPNPVRTVKMSNMSTAGAAETPESTLQRLGTRLLPCAAEGTPACQQLVALLPFSDAQRGSSEHDMLLRAAQGGLARAQYLYGRYLIAFHGKATRNKARAWFDIAMKGGSSRARIAMARLAITDSTAPDWHQARRLLEVARSNRDLLAVVPLAAVLAAAPDAEVRAPLQVDELLDTAYSLRGSTDPTTLEIAAAAAATRADYGTALKTQDKAIKAARKLGWTTTLLEQRRAAYSANQPWFGDLLAY